MNLRKNNLFKIAFVLFITALISTPLMAQEVIDRVVAIVNDDLITLSELRETSLSINPASKQQVDERTVLNQMIESKLFEQEAKRRGITVTEQELDASIEQVRSRYNMNEDQMEEVLKKQNLTPESFREQWRMQTLGNKLLESQLKNKIVVTDDEIEQYYKENYGAIEYSGNFSGDTEKPQEEVEIAHILISPDTTPNAQDKAIEVAELAKSGKDFASLAREYSDDSFTADKGGNLGSFKKGDLIGPLETAVERTPEGKVSGVVQTPAGYHIIKVLNRTKPSSDEKEADSEDETYISDSDREEIRQILHRGKAENQLKTWLEGVREKAYVEIKL